MIDERKLDNNADESNDFLPVSVGIVDEAPVHIHSIGESKYQTLVKIARRRGITVEQLKKELPEV